MAKKNQKISPLPMVTRGRELGPGPSPQAQARPLAPHARSALLTIAGSQTFHQEKRGKVAAPMPSNEMEKKCPLILVRITEKLTHLGSCV